jgi:hypothetical protein
MGRIKTAALVAAVILASCVIGSPVGAATTSAQGHDTHVSANGKKRCHRTHRAPCRQDQTVQSVTGTSGGLTVTFSESQNGSSIGFTIASSETRAYGALGPELLQFGDGSSQGFGTPEYCLVNPISESTETQISHTYGASGTYSASVTVGANCTGDQLTLTLPITIS